MFAELNSLGTKMFTEDFPLALMRENNQNLSKKNSKPNSKESSNNLLKVSSNNLSKTIQKIVWEVSKSPRGPESPPN